MYERIYGLRDLTLIIEDPHKFKSDVVISTHHHEDHLMLIQWIN